MDYSVIISLREQLRIHKASLQAVMQRMDRVSGELHSPRKQLLMDRLDDAFQLLLYYDVTASTILEQHRNLLSLVSLYFNSSRLLAVVDDTATRIQSGDRTTRASCRQTQRIGIYLLAT